MKVKICGMRDAANIEQVLALAPDYLGFVFHEKSPRYTGELLEADQLKAFPKTVKKVGVFVNSHPDSVLKNAKKFGLDFAQLHGDESPDVCRSLRGRGVSIIKTFALDENFNFSRLNNYKSHCDFFLFDTKGEQPGGTGVSFDWDILQRYDNEKPFFLSGGIGPEYVERIQELKGKGLNIHAIDVNSRFETAPGVKNVELLRTFLAALRPPANVQV